jgi:hypothetical protein
MSEPKIKVVASDAVPEGRWLLVVGELSLKAKAELAKRVKAGEDAVAVKAELLLRESKGVVG